MLQKKLKSRCSLSQNYECLNHVMLKMFLFCNQILTASVLGKILHCFQKYAFQEISFTSILKYLYLKKLKMDLSERLNVSLSIHKTLSYISDQRQFVLNCQYQVFTELRHISEKKRHQIHFTKNSIRDFYWICIICLFLDSGLVFVCALLLWGMSIFTTCECVCACKCESTSVFVLT